MTPGIAQQPRARAFIHVGLQKTGTSFLQSHLWDSPAALRAQGVELVPGTRGRAQAVKQAVRGRPDAARAAQVLESLARTVRSSEAPTLLLTQESLAGATEEEAAGLLRCFDGREVHVVVTARDIARQLPSVWQQRVKADTDIGFAEFLDKVREGKGPGRQFWLHQDLVGVLERWTRHVDPARVHVVTVPPRDADRSLLPERFGSVVGVDFSELATASPRHNISLDPVQVEVLRRVNRLRPVEERFERARTVKQFFAGQVLAPMRGEPARTPQTLRDWCQQGAERTVEHLSARGWEVVGELSDLRPRDQDFGPDPSPVTEGDVADVAVRVVADLLERRNEDARELARLRDEVDVLKGEARRPRR